MENIKEQKKNIIIGAVVVIAILGAVTYNNYKKSHKAVVPAGEVTAQTPEAVKPNKNNVVVTPGKKPDDKATFEVVTAKDQIIKDIIDGNYDKAKTEMAVELKKTPKDAELWYINSSLQAQLSDFETAITSVDAALTYDSVNTTYWKWKVNLATKKMAVDKIDISSSQYRDTVKAIYEKALKATNNSAEICAPYAIYLAGIGDKALAITYWQKAEVSNPLAKASYEIEIAKLKAN